MTSSLVNSGNRSCAKTSKGSVIVLVWNRTPDLNRFRARDQCGVQRCPRQKPDSPSELKEAHAEAPAPLGEDVEIWEGEAILPSEVAEARKDGPGDEIVPGGIALVGRSLFGYERSKKEEPVGDLGQVGPVEGKVVFRRAVIGGIESTEPGWPGPYSDDWRRVERSLPCLGGGFGQVGEAGLPGRTDRTVLARVRPRE